MRAKTVSDTFGGLSIGTYIRYKDRGEYEYAKITSPMHRMLIGQDQIPMGAKVLTGHWVKNKFVLNKGESK